MKGFSIHPDTGADTKSALEFADDAECELAQPAPPRRNKLIGCLAGRAGVIQTAAALKPAYEAIMEVVKALGGG